MSALGTTDDRFDARPKTTGAALYACDLDPDQLLHAKVVFTNQPHARLLALDTEACRQAPGVVAVLTGADMPVNSYGLTMADQPVFVTPAQPDRQPDGHDHPDNQPDDQPDKDEADPPVPADVSRWEADHLAIVVAETEAQATAAAQLLAPVWEPLPVVADLDGALAPDAVRLHPERPPLPEPAPGGPPGTAPGGSPFHTCGNAYHQLVIRKGDAERAMDTAAVVVEENYEVPYQEHAYLQTEAAVSYVDDEGRITVETGGQWTHEDQEQIAHCLGLEQEQVRVIYRTIGGAFGGKEDLSLQIVMALATQKLAEVGDRRPIRSRWSREESIVGHHKRHRARVWTRWGATAEGKVVAMQARCLLDAGAYNYTSNKVLGNLTLSVAGPYEIDHASIDSLALYTNAVPGGAFRGFGGPQGAFVAEAQMNRLAEACGLDPVEIRRRNVLTDTSISLTGTPPPPGVSIGTVVEACAESAGFLRDRPTPVPMVRFGSLPPATATVRRGRGFACAAKNVGFSFGFPEGSEARIVLRADPGDGAVPSGAADGLGDGAADGLGDGVADGLADGVGDGDDGPTRADLYVAGADLGQGAHMAFLQMAAEATGLAPDRITGHFSDTATSGDSGSASASRLTFMTGNAILGAAEEADKAWREGARPADGFFRYTPPPTEALDPDGRPITPNFAYGYVAQALDLSVDLATGLIVVHDVVCAIDVGKAINTKLLEGQVEGAVVQAHGYALTEDLQVVDARIVNPRLSTYLIPGIGDIPERVRSVLVEVPDPLGPFGARGMAEMPMLPYAPAVVAALHDATGVWFNQFPLTPSRVLAGLRSAETARG